MNYLCQKCKKYLDHSDFVSEIDPDFEKLAHVIQHGSQRFIVKNIKGESTEANNLSHIL